MKCRELLKIEHPECIDMCYRGGCKGCPKEYGYLMNPDYCNEYSLMYNCDCFRCWDREITPETALTESVSMLIKENEKKQKSNESPHIKDSGERRKFDTGAVRDICEGKGRCDLMPLDVVSFYYAQSEYVNDLSHPVSLVFFHLNNFKRDGDIQYLRKAIEASKIFVDDQTMFLEVAKHFEEGAVKYGDNNWQKGIPVHCYIDSAVRHYLKFLRGDNDEPHDRAFVWNIMCCIWTCYHKPELNDFSNSTKEEKTAKGYNPVQKAYDILIEYVNGPEEDKYDICIEDVLGYLGEALDE